MLSWKDGAAWGSRAIAFALGGVLAFAGFAVLAWDFGHHRTPYVPGMPISPPSPWAGYLPFFWLLYFALMTWLKWLTLRSKGNQGRQAETLDDRDCLGGHVSFTGRSFSLCSPSWAGTHGPMGFRTCQAPCLSGLAGYSGSF